MHPSFFLEEAILFKIEITLNMLIVFGSTKEMYCSTSNISFTFIGNKTVDHSDVVGASPAGAAPTTSSFSN